MRQLQFLSDLHCVVSLDRVWDEICVGSCYKVIIWIVTSAQNIMPSFIETESCTLWNMGRWRDAAREEKKAGALYHVKVWRQKRQRWALLCEQITQSAVDSRPLYQTHKALPPGGKWPCSRQKRPWFGQIMVAIRCYYRPCLLIIWANYGAAHLHHVI